MTSGTRDKMVAGAAELLSRRGMHGTSLREVVRHTETPRGSIGYHFPGGKAQLIEAAVRLAQQDISAILERLLREHGAVGGVRAAFALRGKSLQDSCFEAGCPVLVVAVERYTDDAREAPDANTQQQLLDAANQAFVDWQGIIAAQLAREGVDAARAQRLAALVLSAMEGAVALCRAALGLQALDDVADEVALLMQSAIDEARA
ncbi:TetR family transcriptional regulator [Duganella sp. FT92W]|uniref:TetR family transcriptional regulator n=1 Tax=Pseudoduganella rivuli TaxID=2666085 RepID=A0A7X2IQC1_9BURK|nr:helix-turn-helix domain-containing protein [Pseudoduganella rivuli]MRV73985.1 TetR family transcriptional regulator [Pseudoduganella rivuli]